MNKNITGVTPFVTVANDLIHRAPIFTALFLRITFISVHDIAFFDVLCITCTICSIYGLRI